MYQLHLKSQTMPLYFITSNPNKLQEVKAILPEVEQLDIDLPEIQHIDAKEIIKAKLKEALNHTQGEFLVEDTSLYLECLGGLPGPLVKWFLKTIGNEGLFEITKKLGNDKAQTKTMIGYARRTEEIYFFEGNLQGKIVKPQGDQGFGWDPIFKPEGFNKTFGQMSQKEKSRISMRKKALENLKMFLKEKGE